MREEEFLNCLILKNTPGLGARTWKKLIHHFKTAKDALENLDEWPYLNVRSDIICAIKQKKGANDAEKEYKLWQKKKYNILLLSNNDYPELLKEIPDPPIIIYYKGEKNLLNNYCIAIVGSRKTSVYGREIAEKLARDLSNAGITIVSGLAVGIDTLAHKGALLGVGSTIAVLGTGIDVNYPAQNRMLKEHIIKKGLILSEFSPTTPPNAENFPIRNRLISGLSLGIIVVQAAKKSGSLITAKYALEQNRLIFSIPGPVNLPYFEGNNQLLRNGAILIRDSKDILIELAPIINLPELDKNIDKYNKRPSLNIQPSSEIEEKIVNYLLKRGEAGINEMSEDLTIDSSTLMATLVQMEVSGKIKKGQNNQYSLE